MIARSTMLTALAPLVLGGCSFVMLRSPHPVSDPRSQSLGCSTSSAPIVTDVLLGLGAAVATIAIASDPCARQPGDELGIGQGICEDTKPIGAALSGTTAVLYAASALHGVSARGRCMEASTLQDRCRDGDGAACLELSPGNVPAPAPVR